MSFNFSPKIVTDGLVLYLDAANNKSYSGTGTLWKDITGSGYDGLLTNSPTFLNENKGNFLFDGINEYVVWGSNVLSPLTNITYDCWFKCDGSAYSFFTISSQNLRIYYQHTNSTWYIAFGGQNIFFTRSYDTNWTNFTYRYDGVTHFCNVNGINYPFTLGSGTSSQVNLRISGRDNIGAEFNFKGSVANTKIYNRSLSTTEILQNYNTTKNRFEL